MAKTIKDPILGDYEIKVEGSFTLIKNSLTQPKEGEERRPTQTAVGYYSTLLGALNAASKALVEERMPNVATLRAYIGELKALKLEIMQKFQEIEP